jgi:5-(carboxyamino)imidazole ribonucleotide synthase
LYGKAEARRGRKMGHINILGSTLSQANAAAAQAAQVLGIPFQS